MATVQAALAFITYYTGFYLHLSTYKRYLALQFHTYIHLCYLTLVDRSEIGEVYKVSLDPTVEELCPVSSYHYICIIYGHITFVSLTCSPV